MTTKAKWILASASPRRREILHALGLNFQVDPSTAPEPERKQRETPAHYVLRAARAKVIEIGRKYDSGLVIGADTIVVINDKLLGKPSSEMEARAMLQLLHGRWHEVITGVGLMNCSSGKISCDFNRSRVHFRRLSSSQMQWYLATGEYADKAGAYAIQGFASLFIDRIEGCYFNIVGFPVTTFGSLCRRMRIDLMAELKI